MNLHDHLTDTLDRIDETGPDLARLTAVARTRGTRLRRRRTAGLAVAGVAASAAVLGLLGVTLGGPDGDREVPVATDAPAPAPRPGPSGPIVAATPRGVAAALAWAVEQQRPGTAADFAGQGGTASVVGDLFATFTWDDADGAGVSEVGANVQFDREGDDLLTSCDSCRQVTRPDGSVLTTSAEKRTGGGVMRTASLVRDGVRVAVYATNGRDLGDTFEVTRSNPPLTVSQLAQIAEQSFWGHTLPQSFVTAGDELTPYVDIDARSAAAWDVQPISPSGS